MLYAYKCKLNQNTEEKIANYGEEKTQKTHLGKKTTQTYRITECNTKLTKSK